jgi:glycosyltransferase involved in cell wall biosynthesis
MTNPGIVICLVTSGMCEKNLRLQPWRYIWEVGKGLADKEYDVTFISDGGRNKPYLESLQGLKVIRLRSVSRPKWGKNKSLSETLKIINPYYQIWHIGLTSFMHQRLIDWEIEKVIGFFSSPVSKLSDFMRLGVSRLVKNIQLSGVPIAGAMIPRGVLRGAIRQTKFSTIITQTESSKLGLAELWNGSIQVIPPGVDPTWLKTTISLEDKAGIRRDWGFNVEDKLLLYYGAPAMLRGTFSLIEAFEHTVQYCPELRLVLLCRQRENETNRDLRLLEKRIGKSLAHDLIYLEKGFLDPEILVRKVAASDIVTLPFELIPSDAPLSILESLALGKPLVTTQVGCLPELSKLGKSFVAKPADSISLAEAIIKAYDASFPLDSPPRFCRTWNDVSHEWEKLLNSL